MVEAPAQSDLLRFIPALPLAGALVHGVLLTLVRRPMSRLLVVLLSCGVVLASFGVSLLAVLELLRLPAESRLLVDELYTWIGSGRFSAELAFQLDPHGEKLEKIL